MKTVVLIIWFLSSGKAIHSHEFFDLQSCVAAGKAVEAKVTAELGRVPYWEYKVMWVCVDNPLTNESKE